MLELGKVCQNEQRIAAVLVPEGFVTLLIPPVVLSVPQAEFRLPDVQPGTASLDR